MKIIADSASVHTQGLWFWYDFCDGENCAAPIFHPIGVHILYWIAYRSGIKSYPPIKCEHSLKVWPVIWSIFSSTFTRYYLFYSNFGNFGEFDLATFKIGWGVSIWTKENQEADFNLSEKVLTCMSTCKKRELALNNTTVVIMKLKCAAVLCVC